MKQYESHIWGAVVSVIAMLLLFLLLWFVYFDRPHVDEEEGIEVVYGEELEAGNDMQEPLGAPEEGAPAPAVSVPQPPAPSTPSTNDLIVQDHSQSLELQRQAEEKRRKTEEAAAELRRQQEEAARLQREAEAAAAKAAEEEAKRQKASSLVMGALSGGGSGAGSGSGTTSGDSKPGNPAGRGTVGRNQWSLAGRDVKSLPSPDNSFNQEGTVVVSITVDAAGKVISAKATGGNVSDSITKKLAEDAAKKAVFSAGESEVRGTITYTFKFN